MAQLQFLSLPEINMLVQMLCARVSVLESIMTKSSSGTSLMSENVHGVSSVDKLKPPTSSVGTTEKSRAIPILDPALLKHCADCNRVFLHLKHLKCNRCNRRAAKEKKRNQLLNEEGVSSGEGDVKSKPEIAKPLPTSSSGGASISSDSRTPRKPARKQVKVTIHPAPKTVSTSLAIGDPGKRLRPKGKLAARSKVGTSPHAFTGLSAPFVPDTEHTVEEVLLEECPEDMKPRLVKKFLKNYGPCPERFDEEPETEAATFVLRKEWQHYADLEASFMKAKLAYSKNFRDGVLHTASGKRVAAYQEKPPPGMTVDTIKYLTLNPDVQPWILRNGPSRSLSDLPELLWTRPPWIGKRKTPCQRKTERKRLEVYMERKADHDKQTGYSGEGLSQGFSVGATPFVSGEVTVSGASSVDVKAVLLPVDGEVIAPAAKPSYLSLPAPGSLSPKVKKPKQVPEDIAVQSLPVTPQTINMPAVGTDPDLNPFLVKEGFSVSPPSVIWDEESNAKRGAAFKSFLTGVRALYANDQKPRAGIACDFLFRELYKREIITKEGAVKILPKWITKKHLEEIFVMLKSCP